MSRTTQDTTRLTNASDKGLSPAMVQLSRCFSSHSAYHGVVLQPPRCVATTRVWAVPRSLATTGGITSCFLFLRVLRCFSSPRWPPDRAGCHPFRMTGCPIRRSADQRSFAPPRGFSQLITSFVASESQGIRHAPFPTSCARGPKAACRPGLATRDFVFRFDVPTCHRTRRVYAPVENNGFEPLTPCLQSRCSSQLS